MRTTGGHRLPWVVAVAVLGTFALTAVLFTIDLSFGLMSGSAIASMTLVGALLMTRAAGNLVGGLLLAAGVLLTAAVVMGTYAEAGLAGSAPPPTAVGIAFVLNDALFVPPMVMLLIGVPLFFPDGHLLSRRWRVVVWLTVAAIAARTVASRSVVTAEMSTSSRRRAENAALVRSPSYRARSNRRSTTCWTRRRTGVNSAATTSVEAATAKEFPLASELKTVVRTRLTAR